MKQLADFETTICGIPCGITINDFSHAEPNPRCTDSDVDYYGYTEIDWTVLDRKGYLAEWLRKKMDKKEVEQIDQEVYDFCMKEPEPDEPDPESYFY